jgi:serine/threonine-protein kinase RsbT
MLAQIFMNIQDNSDKSSKELSGKTFSLGSVSDVIEIRKYGRKLAGEIGFKSIDQTLIATAISEICRNVIEYADSGEVIFEIRNNHQTCFAIVVKDEGPGIEDIEAVLREGFSKGKGLGIGLPGAKRLMDEFEIRSTLGEGTTVEMCKYLEHE